MRHEGAKGGPTCLRDRLATGVRVSREGSGDHGEEAAGRLGVNPGNAERDEGVMCRDPARCCGGKGGVWPEGRRATHTCTCTHARHTHTAHTAHACAHTSQMHTHAHTAHTPRTSQCTHTTHVCTQAHVHTVCTCTYTIHMCVHTYTHAHTHEHNSHTTRTFMRTHAIPPRVCSLCLIFFTFYEAQEL